MKTILRFLLTTPATPPPCTSMDVWWTRHKALAARYEAPVDAALAAGFISDRLGWAFASGYRAALQSLLPSLPADKVIALAVTEAEGGHPRAIQTTLTRAGDTIALSGHKSHITLGQHADAILVLARSGEVDGRPNLELVSVDKHTPGVTLQQPTRMPFAPEIEHRGMILEDVQLPGTSVLSGDAWEQYVRPFRTVEDCHVHAAALAYLLQVCRRSGWPMRSRDELVAQIVTMRALSLADPSAAGVHVALGAAITQLKGWLRQLTPAHWDRVEPETRSRWERDRALLDVAGKARAARLTKALERLKLL